jgi:hypothetical protein
MSETLKNFAGGMIPEIDRARIRTEKDVTTLEELMRSHNK